MKHLTFILACLTSTVMAQTDTLPNFDKLWNFGDPAATEAKFRELLPRAAASGDSSYQMQLMTQIARTYSLRGKFGDAHRILDEIEPKLSPDLKLARVRYLLERGRSYNSAGVLEKATSAFLEAYELGASINAWRFTVDAVHMLAIAQTDPAKQVEWNLKGIALAEEHEQKGWLDALYNNIGEAYLRLKDYSNAQKYFHLLAERQKTVYGEADIYTLKDEAKAFRLMGKPGNALEMMEAVYKTLSEKGNDDGWIREELAEDLYALDRKNDSKPHFIKAYELLSKDDYCIQFEAEKLKHLKEMSERFR